MNLFEAITSLNSSIVTLQDDVAYNEAGEVVPYDLSAAEALVAANAYKDQRAAAYPLIGDQLDALFKAGVFPAEMAAVIQAVKDKYPKETL
tara:strand:- start:120 stop:392 length:273 start_codon:yes stop_codon:yes gene_type:complete